MKSTVLGKLVFAGVLGGFIAEWFARTDPNVDDGVAALAAGDGEAALAAFTLAVDERGPLPEIEFDKGLAYVLLGDVEAAKTAFEHGTESDDPVVRASSHYALGNLAFDAEDWEGAIAQYTDCLRARPDHANAKWNLELALAKRDEQREEEEKDEQKDENQDGQDDQPPQPEDGESSTGDTGESGEEPEGETGSPPEDGDDQGSTDAGASPEEGTSTGEGEPEGGGGDTGQDPEQSGQQEPPKPEPGAPDSQDPKGQGKDGKPPPSPQPSEAKPGAEGEAAPEGGAAAKPIDQADLDRALQQLDQQDGLDFLRPGGTRRTRRVEKDW